MATAAKGSPLPLKSAHLALQAAPVIAQVGPLLGECEALLKFELPPGDSTMDQREAVRRYRRKADTTHRLLETQLNHLQALYDEWGAVVRTLGQKEAAQQIAAEQEAYAEMNNAPEGLRATLHVGNTMAQKLVFLDEDLEQIMVQLALSVTPLIQSEPARGGQSPAEASPPTAEEPRHATARDPGSHWTPSVRLPQLELPTFDGNTAEWFPFWDLFTATVDRHPHLADVEKLAYLFGCLRGNAKAVARGYQMNGSSYATIVSALKLQFGDEDLQARALHLDLRRVRSPVHTASDLLRFHNDAIRLIHQMRVVHVDPDHPTVLYTLEEHLPETTRLMMRAERDRVPVKTAAEFCTALLAVARLLSTVQTVRMSSENSQGSQQAPFRERVHTERGSDGGNRYGSASPRGSSSREARSFGHQRPVQQSSAFAGTTGASRAPQRSRGRESPRKLSPCAFCGGDHRHKDCRQYRTISDRRARAAALHLCFRCLKTGHISNNCSGSGLCRSCSGSHHTLLCKDNATHTEERSYATTVVTATPDDHSPALDEVREVSGLVTLPPSEKEGETSTVLLLWQTARIYNPLFPGTLKGVKAFLDQGSQSSFVTEKLAEQLGLEKKHGGPLIIHGVGDADGNAFPSALVSLGVRLTDGSSHMIEARTLPRITEPFLHAHISDEDLPALWKSGHQELPVPLYKDAPDILIGSNFISAVNPHLIKRLDSGFALYESGLGPLVGGSGRVPTRFRVTPQLQTASVVVGSVQMSAEDLWSLDSLGIDMADENVEDEERALAAFTAAIRRLPDGRYSVSWPWKSNQPRLATNFGLCVGRLQSVLRNLAKQPERRQLYHDILMQQLKSGIIERAPLQPSGPLVHYVAHQAVWNEEKKKLRVVYDASSSAPRGQSLNDNLLRGPVFLPDLVGQLLRLRNTAIAIVADVEQAFLQVALNPADRDVTRFLWVDHPEEPIGTANPIIAYRFQRVFFGAISSPFLLAATILHHLRTSESPWATRIANNTYVDNVLLTANSVEDAKTAYYESKRLFAEAHMNLRDYQSNSDEVNEVTAPEDRHGSSRIKVLGILWDTARDTLTVTTKSPPLGPITKRSLLRFVAQHYDPLGYLAPSILLLKMFLQDVTKEDVAWDTPVSEARKTEWIRLREAWKTVPFPISRRLPSGAAELHIFCDASTRAFATVVYVKGGDGVALLYAKSRLCPLKGLTVPRLELLAILIGVRASRFVISQLHMEDTPCTLWSDSKCALAWVKSNVACKVPRFVQNRLTEIRKSTGITYAYVSTELNPADLGTRGLLPNDLLDEKKWWEGPEWLASDKSLWPHVPESPVDEPSSNSEEPDTSTTTAVTQIGYPLEEHFALLDMGRFSTWNRVREVAAWTLRFITKISNPPPTWLQPFSTHGPLTATDFAIAERCLLRQAQAGATTLDDMRRWELSKDEHGLWRCGGRLTETQLPRSEQHPIFLPQKSQTTQLLILREHTTLLHGGAPATLARLRQRYWIPHGRKTVKSALRSHCAHCRRWSAKPFALPPMPSLPATRVCQAPAFGNTGVDLMGPIRVSGAKKRWIVLFTCLVTRAVHLEVAEDLSAWGLVDALRRFFARRGIPEHIVSDNGTNLTLTAKALRDIPEAKTLSWSFITALAPWQGGVYERLVGLTKSCFRRAIGRRLMEDAELRTLTAEVEAVLNERPITYVEADSLDVLRPIDYLRPRAHLALNIPSSENEEKEFEPRLPSSRQKLLEQWGQSQACRDKFWSLWHHEYLQLLRDRERRFHQAPYAQERRSPHIGEVVLLQDEAAPRGLWKLAKVIATPLGSGNVVRTAKVRLASGRVLERVISQLYPLEVGDDSPSAIPDEHPEELENEPPQSDKGQSRRVTRSMTRKGATAAGSVAATTLTAPMGARLFFLFLCGATLVRASQPTVQICPFRHTGILAKFPPPTNCEMGSSSTWQTRKIAIYRRQLVAVNATYCTKISRTLCTWAFLRYSMRLTNDSTVAAPVSVAECEAMRQDKRIAGYSLSPTEGQRWSTTNPPQSSFGWFGSRCTTTDNYILEEGQVTFYEGNQLLTDFTRTQGCEVRANQCITRHETIVWSYAEFSHQCRYRFAGTHTAHVSAEEILIDNLQTALIRAKQPPVVAENCGLREPLLMENDIVVSFSVEKGPVNADMRLAGTRRSFLSEQPVNLPDPENVRMQYLHDIEVRRNAQRWCEIRNMFFRILRWISLQDPTAAVRLLLGRNDIAAHQSGENVLITKCQDAKVTKTFDTHKVDGRCYERLPVHAGATLAFVEPYSHDLVLQSREVPCPWVAPRGTAAILQAKEILHLANAAHAVVFNATRTVDLSTELLQLALDRLGRRAYLAVPMKPDTTSGMSSTEEFLTEMGHKVETVTEAIENTLEIIMARWRLATIAVFAVAAIIAGCWLKGAGCSICKNRREAVSISLELHETAELTPGRTPPPKPNTGEGTYSPPAMPSRRHH